MRRLTPTTISYVLLAALTGSSFVSCSDDSGSRPEVTNSTGDTVATVDESDGSTGVSDETNTTTTTDTTTGTTSENTDDNCFSEDVVPTVIAPNVVVTIDKSGSMSSNNWLDGDGASRTRWESLYNTVKFVTDTYDDRINFGLKLFPSKSASEQGDASCLVDEGVEVPVAPNNGDAIMAAMPPANAQVKGGTPAVQGLRAAFEHLVTLPVSSAKRAIVLIMDGRVGCSGSNPDGDLRAQAKASFDAGIEVFVIGIDVVPDVDSSDSTDDDDPNLPNDLDSLALAGGTDRYYRSEDSAELKAAMEKITGIVASCELSYGSAPRSWNLLKVNVNSMDYRPVGPAFRTCEESEAAAQAAGKAGWVVYKDETLTRVDLCGTACYDFKGGQVAQVKLECIEGRDLPQGL